ncbi:alternate signal-mediated exported protein [Nocardioides aromaticivorans]|uniref:Alternate signal-mediated exported protein n=1 Tax=Nocardioides aromaticivorans TaxID=200618 RepID=A0A7Y9ZNM5_9ACTN|nr:alternate-type signal peptide domain-containing protein [Nocardioides aromaticivorans]NYI47628.1 alternate signal-mediated exported protein [Nocardioides aromaticivorans]
MKKTTKGALAAGGAAVLLMGGAGTLAFWTADADVEGIAATAGELKIINDTCADADWVFDSGEDEASKVWEAGDLIVPGDTLTKTCSFEVQATGEHLRANLDVTDPTRGGSLTGTNLTIDDSFQIDGTDVADGVITEANDGDVVDASITITFLGTAGNGTQTQNVTLSDFGFSLTQVHS